MNAGLPGTTPNDAGSGLTGGSARTGRFAGIRSLARNSPSLIGGGIVVSAILICCLAAPLLSRYAPEEQNLDQILQGPGSAHLFGTDQYGRDVFTRVLYGGRTDFFIGAVLVGIALVVGTMIGIVAAWVGGLVDGIVLWLLDVGFAFPFLVLVITMVGFRGPGVTSLIIAVSLVAWIFYARLVRGEVLVMKNANYIKAARLSGFSAPRILVRHVLPNVATQVLLYATSDIVYAILLGASVSYLGLGVQPPTPEWGAMVQEGQTFITTEWWVAFFPGLAIAVTGIGFAFLGDGLADFLRRGRS